MGLFEHISNVNDKLRTIRKGQLICAQFGRVLRED